MINEVVAVNFFGTYLHFYLSTLKWPLCLKKKKKKTSTKHTRHKIVRVFLNKFYSTKPKARFSIGI